jgi:DNA-binding CsgD family transcriptional regulator
MVEPTLAVVAAIQGRTAACQEHAGVAEALGTKRQDLRARGWAGIARGLLALGDGRPAEAVVDLEPVAALSDGVGLKEPGVLPFAPDLIEAHARAGSLEAAQAQLNRFTAQAQAAGRRWALAAAARCRGLLADGASLDHPFEEALALGEHGSSPFELARTRLCYGERLRRANRRKEARVHLRAALEHFDQEGALPWIERASAELRATGQAVARRDPSAPERLTPQELQIALLVAGGKSNRDVAGAMFVSRKTVEYHLSNVYRKLDIHSRAELTRLFAAHASGSATVPGGPPPAGLAR